MRRSKGASTITILRKCSACDLGLLELRAQFCFQPSVRVCVILQLRKLCEETQPFVLIKLLSGLVTFNYDDSLERELSRAGVWDVSRGYGFPLGAEDTPSKTLLLKLHGSMNWLIVPEPERSKWVDGRHRVLEVLL
jgi:hypothetical protein